MRNYKAKPHQGHVNTLHSFQKSSRKYPQARQVPKQPGKTKPITKQIKQAVQRQAQKEVQEMQMYIPQTIISKRSDPQISHFMVQQPFCSNKNTLQNDPYCLWYRTLQSDASTTKTIKVSCSDYILSNWNGDNFPNTFYICFDGISGFLDKYGCLTNRLAALQLKQFQPIVQNESLTYELKYQINPIIRQWQIPQSLSNLKMTLKQDDNQLPVQLPLVNPLNIQIQISQRKHER